MLQSIPNHLNSSILSLVKNLFVYIEMTSKLKMRWFLSRKKTLFLFQPFSVFYRMYFYFQFISNKHHPRLIETVTMMKATVYFQYVSTSKLSSYCFLPHSLCAHGFCNSDFPYNLDGWDCDEYFRKYRRVFGVHLLFYQQTWWKKILFAC